MTVTETRVERSVVLVLAALENLFHAATLFGWPSFVYVLKDMGYYSNLCPVNTTVYNATSSPEPLVITVSTMANAKDEDPAVCDEQDARLVLIYTISSSLVPINMLFGGVLFERTGNLLTRLLFTVLLFFGYLCIGFSSPEIPDLLFPGTIIIGSAGIIILVSTIEVSNLFRDQKSTVIGLLNGCSDSSAFVFLLIKLTYEAGIAVNVSFFILAASTLFFNVNTILLPRTHIPWPLPKHYRLPVCANNAKLETESADVYFRKSTDDLGESRRSVSTQTYGLNLIKGNGTVKFEETLEGNAFENSSFELEEEEEENIAMNGVVIAATTQDKDTVTNTTPISCSAIEEAMRKSDYPTLWSCLKSPMFILMTLWSIACQGEIFFVIGIMNAYLTLLAEGDTDVVSFYTDILAIMNIGSLFGAPVAGFLFDRNKIGSKKKGISRGPYSDLKDSCLPVATATTIAICMSISMMIHILPVQFATFVFLTLVRSMFYGASAAVVPVTFPMMYYPTIFGTANFLIGLFSLTQFPLFILIQEVLNNDPFWVIAGFMIANVLTYSYPIYIYWYVRNKEKQLRNEMEEAVDPDLASTPSESNVVPAQLTNVDT